jgi:hypothetical protein
MDVSHPWMKRRLIIPKLWHHHFWTIQRGLFQGWIFLGFCVLSQ